MDGISILLKMDWIQDVIVPISDSVGMLIIQVIDHSVCNHTNFRHWPPEQGNQVCISAGVRHPLQKHTFDQPRSSENSEIIEANGEPQ